MYLENVTVHGFKAADRQPLECVLPGRFAVLAGANSSGKSTIVDSLVLAHQDVFPFTRRPSSNALSREVSNRTIEISYALETSDNSPLGLLYKRHGRIPHWTTSLTSSMGRISASRPDAPAAGQLPVMYLSPTRNPGLDLAGREARLIVELLRAQALRDKNSKSLKRLRSKLGGLIASVLNEWPVADVERRVTASLSDLTDGVSARVPFLGTTAVDDAFLARIFEFSLGLANVDRASSIRIEAEGLGYANLLQLAVVLAAIPDLSHDETADGQDSDEGISDGDGYKNAVHPAAQHRGGQDLDSQDDDVRTDEDRIDQMAEAEELRELTDDTFFAGQFHALVVLEEPEAHLHPQLQHGLVRYLKEVVQERLEVQIILTTHSDEIVAACDPEDLVIFRRSPDRTPSARTVKSFDLAAEQIARARRHLDVTRSASIFAERAVLVEGITDAIVLRAIGRIWAGEDRARRRFIDSLTITVVGSRIGPWLPALLVADGNEIVNKLAILCDSDGKPVPQWVERQRSAYFDVFLSEPTLEPSLAPGNDKAVAAVLSLMGVTIERSNDDGDEVPLEEALATYFAKKGKSRKAEFADAFAAYCDTNPAEVSVPQHFQHLFEFVWEGFIAEVTAQRERATVSSEG